MVGAIFLDIFFFIIGGIILLSELISSGSSGIFATLPFPTQILFVGLWILGICLLVLFLSVLYRRGRNGVIKTLYGICKTPSIEPEIKIFKIFVNAFLISAIVVFAGIIFTTFSILTDHTAIAFDANVAFDHLSTGQQILFINAIIFLCILLSLGTQFLWRNGYNFFLLHILRHNNNVIYRIRPSTRQKNVSSVVYAVILAACLLMLFGVISIALESMTNVGTAWDAFLGYSWGFQVLELGILGTILFGVLILLMYQYKRTNNWIQIALFIRPPDLTKNKDVTTRIVVLGMLFAIFLIIFAGISAFLSVLIQEFFTIDTTILITAIHQLETGYILLTYGALLLIFTMLAIVLAFYFNNGYSFILAKVSVTEDKIDQSLEKITHFKRESKKEEKTKEVIESKPASSPATTINPVVSIPLSSRPPSTLSPQPAVKVSSQVNVKPAPSSPKPTKIPEKSPPKPATKPTELKDQKTQKS